MTPATRFSLWKCVVLLLLIGQPTLLLLNHAKPASPESVRTFAWLFQLPIAALLALLITTPANAIRLPPLRSQGIVLGGTLLLYAVALATHHSMNRTIPAVILLGMTSSAVILLRSANVSPWWIVPAAWNPVILCYLAA